MELPKLADLKEAWYTCQNQDPVEGGYCAIVNNDDMLIPFFANDIVEWRYLWLAIQFNEALWEEDYEIYDKNELKETEEILSKIDFDNFEPGPFLPIDSTIYAKFEGTVIDWAIEKADELRSNMG